jgi:hypothetical protein
MGLYPDTLRQVRRVAANAVHGPVERRQQQRQICDLGTLDAAYTKESIRLPSCPVGFCDHQHHFPQHRIAEFPVALQKPPDPRPSW